MATRAAASAVFIAAAATAAASAAAAAADPLGGAPIWCANATSKFALLRAPDFSLRAWPPASATLRFAARGSPRPPAGTTQAKLLGAAAPRVNGVLVAAGPGHNVPTDAQVARALDVLPFLRPGVNALGFGAFFDREYAQGAEDVPRVQADLVVVDAQGSYVAASTDATWTAWAADAYHNPTGNAGVSWYPMPNENLDTRARPVGWSEPGFAAAWPTASLQPAWPGAASPPYLEAAPPPVTLVRRACAVLRPRAGRQILDAGQEVMGGVNLSFALAQAGDRVTVTLAEELLADGSGVLSPARTGNRWNATWTLSGDAARDAGVHHHEFVQFRWAQIDGARDVFEAGTEAAQLWVVQHAAGGDGRNTWEIPCAVSTPAADAYGSGVPPAARTPLASWASSNAALDAVFNFSAYTIVATSLDVNVDGQTRERDVDIVDALNNALGQFYVLSPGDSSISRRTMLEAFTNDTGMWSQWLDFKTSTVILAHAHALLSGDTALLAQLWSDSDNAIQSDAGGGAYNSLQFLACLRYFNASGNGLLSFDPKGACGGSWACEPLVDWPTSTRDGYDCGVANYEDTVRSSLGALAYGALADIAGWLGKTAAAARYASMRAAVLSALRRLNLRQNSSGGEAFFVDGAAGASANHAAVHSTLYAISAGAADGDAALGAALTAFLRRHGVAPSSCMMGRWWVTGLQRLGAFAAEAADLALDVLTAEEYPSWLDMMRQGATTTMEAWRPQDKSNLDWAHPWCASPSFNVPGGVLGAAALAPGWTRFRVAPQPSDVTHIAAAVPSPAGMIAIEYVANWASNVTEAAAAAAGSAVLANATLTLTVLPGQLALVCVAVPGRAAEAAAAAAAAASDVLLVDGSPQSVPLVEGRFLCTAEDLVPGTHTVARILSS
jgi:hypothetical protein